MTTALKVLILIVLALVMAKPVTKLADRIAKWFEGWRLAGAKDYAESQRVSATVHDITKKADAERRKAAKETSKQVKKISR